MQGQADVCAIADLSLYNFDVADCSKDDEYVVGHVH